MTYLRAAVAAVLLAACGPITPMDSEAPPFDAGQGQSSGEGGAAGHGGDIGQGGDGGAGGGSATTTTTSSTSASTGAGGEGGEGGGPSEPMGITCADDNHMISACDGVPDTSTQIAWGDLVTPGAGQWCGDNEGIPVPTSACPPGTPCRVWIEGLVPPLFTGQCQ